MKITYTDKPIGKKPTLEDLKRGTVFRPINSRDIYIRSDLLGEDYLLTERGDNIWRYVVLVGSEPFEDKAQFDESYDYDSFIVCVSLESGNVVVFFDGIEVVPLECELLVKGD